MIRLFREKEIEEAFKVVFQNVQKPIDRLSDNEILNGNLDQIAEDISQRFQISELEIDFNNRDVNTVMTNIPGSLFPVGTDVKREQYYPCAEVKYTFYIQSGNAELLSVKPRKALFNHDVEADVKDNQFTIGYQTRYANVNLSNEVKEEVKQAIRSIIESMRQEINAINDEVATFNDQLKDKVKEFLEKKRKEIQKRNEQNNDLNNL